MQLTLNIQPEDPYKSDNFIMSDSNKTVYEKIVHWQNSWGVSPYKNTILIYGSKSCGKTFCSKIFQNLSGAYLIKDRPAEDVVGLYPAFIIEDIENIEERVLLHNFNLINENQKYLLLTSQNKQFNFNILDLSSRIQSILQVELSSPNHELVKILLFKIFSNHSIKLDPKVLEFLANRLPRDFSKIICAAEAIAGYSLEHKRRVTVPMIKEVLIHYF
jgi:chromosomal replication initiation ATPase DnaA